MFAELLTTTPKATQSYDLHVDLSIINFTVGYEWILFILGLVTATVAIRSFRAARRQNELSTVPILLLQQDGQGNASIFRLVNLTDRFAYNIKISPVYLTYADKLNILRVEFLLDGKNYIGGRESLQLSERVLDDGAVSTEKFANIISNMPSMSERKNSLLVRFRDSQGIEYYTKIGFARGNERIVQAPTKLTYVRSIWLKLTSVRVVLRNLRRYLFKPVREYPAS
jgi:hypothetical protein